MNVPSIGLPELEDAKSFLDALDQQISETTLVPVSTVAQRTRTGDAPVFGSEGHETWSGQVPFPPAQSAPLIVDPVPTLPELDFLDAPIVRNDGCIIDFHDDGSRYLCTERLDTIDEKLTRIQEDMYVALQGIVLLLNKYDLLDALGLALAVAGAPVPVHPYIKGALGAGVLLDCARKQLPPTGDPIYDVQLGLKYQIESMKHMWQSQKTHPDAQRLGILKDEFKKVTPWLVNSIKKLREEIDRPIPDDPQAQLEARVRKPKAEEQLREALDLLRQLNQLSGEVLQHDLPIDPELLDEVIPRGSSLQPTSFHIPAVDLMEWDASFQPKPTSRPAGEVSVKVEPIKLEVFLHDKRLELRATQGPRKVEVDMTTGPRMVGYLAV
jgi:hypothetical protein